MTDVFISYARVNRDTAQALAVGLEATGLNVWWDRELTGGGDFAAEIEQHLHDAPVVLVLWSAASVKSDFVRDESSRARDRDTLLPLRIEAVPLPLGFGTLHTLDLLDWDGDPADDAFQAVLSQVQTQVAAARAAQATGAAPASRALARAAAVGAAGTDPLARQRDRRRWMSRLGGVGVLAVGGGAWFTWRASQRREALAHLSRGLAFQFGETQGQAQAGVEYSLATQLDPDLADAHYYWAHLTVAELGRAAPPFLDGEREGLQNDAISRFTRALARPELLGGGRTAVARQHLALLTQAEAAPLTRAVADGPVASINPAAPTGASPTATPPPPPPPPPGPAAGLPATATRPPTDTITGRPVGSGADRGSLSGAALPASPAPPSAPQPAPAPAARAPLPRNPAAPERQQRARQLAEGLFATGRDARLAAQSALALDPALGAEALPQVVGLALQRLQAPPLDDAGRAGLAALTAMLGRATPAVLRLNLPALGPLVPALAAAPAGAAGSLADALREAGERAGQGGRPRVYLQVASARQMGVARQLAARLEAAGYRVPPIETTGEARAPRQPELRSHGGSDPGLARWCQAALAAATGSPVVWQPLRQVRADTDTYEMWFDAALCAPNGRPAPACSS